jgi:Skp family chaperone for outer membrane proteins
MNVRISRERLTHISDMRTFIEEKNALEEENLRSDEDLQKYETRLHELDGELAKAQAELEKILASDIYASYLRLEEDTGQQGRQLEKLHESWESQIRIAIPVWKRSAKAFQEQGRTEDEKKMEELIHLASSPRRDDEKVAGEVSSTAESLFSLFDSGTLQAKNSFEKQLFTSAEEYTKRFNEVFTGLHALSADLDAKMQDLNANPAMEQKNRAAQEIGDVKRKIDDLNREEEKRKERLSSLAERKESVLEDLKKSFSEFAGEETDLVMDGKEQ